MKKLSLLAAVLLTACTSSGVKPFIVNLYDGPAPGSETWDWEEFRLDNEADGQTYLANVTSPTLEFFLPEKSKATGAAMVVCPGGGHQILSYTAEGTNVAEWLAEHGVAAIVLKYRLIHFARTPEEAFYYVLGLPERQIPDEEKEAMQEHRRVANALSNDDGRAAIAYVRAHAAEYGIDPDRIGIMGFSAGAGVTSNVTFNNDESSRPNLIAPIYGGNMLGHTTPPEPSMPLFLAAPQYDLSPGYTGFAMYEAWKKAGLPAELHYFAECEHGFGYKDDGAPVNEWIELLYQFMQKVDFLK